MAQPEGEVAVPTRARFLVAILIVVFVVAVVYWVIDYRQKPPPPPNKIGEQVR